MMSEVALSGPPKASAYSPRVSSPDGGVGAGGFASAAVFFAGLTPSSSRKLFHLIHGREADAFQSCRRQGAARGWDCGAPRHSARRTHHVQLPLCTRGPLLRVRPWSERHAKGPANVRPSVGVGAAPVGTVYLAVKCDVHTSDRSPVVCSFGDLAGGDDRGDARP